MCVYSDGVICKFSFCLFCFYYMLYSKVWRTIKTWPDREMLLKLNVHINHLEMLLSWRFWFSWRMMGPQILFMASSLVILLLLVHIRQLECQKDYFQWKNLRKPQKPFICDFKSIQGIKENKIFPSLSGFCFW